MTVLATALLYEGALLRSDTSHLTGTLLMVPALVVATATVLPRLLGLQRRGLAAVAALALVAGSCALLPRGAASRAGVRTWAEAPARDRQRAAAGPRPRRAGDAGRYGELAPGSPSLPGAARDRRFPCRNSCG